MSDKKPKKISKQRYEEELFKLQLELVKLQAWITAKKLKVVVLFEGRDAAGKGGVILHFDGATWSSMESGVEALTQLSHKMAQKIYEQTGGAPGADPGAGISAQDRFPGQREEGHGRGGKGHVVINTGREPVDIEVPTALPAGTYLDLVSGETRGAVGTDGVLSVSVDAQRAFAVLSPD